MPISPANMALYPGGSIKSPEWQAIRAFIRARAGDCCEECGVRNGAIGYRLVGLFGQFVEKPGAVVGEMVRPISQGRDIFPKPVKVIRIVCTVAHLDHDVSHNHETNLRFWCQKCHLTHDAGLHASNARVTRAEKAGQLDLIGRAT